MCGEDLGEECDSLFLHRLQVAACLHTLNRLLGSVAYCISRFALHHDFPLHGQLGLNSSHHALPLHPRAAGPTSLAPAPPHLLFPKPFAQDPRRASPGALHGPVDLVDPLAEGRECHAENGASSSRADCLPGAAGDQRQLREGWGEGCLCGGFREERCGERV